MKIKKKIKKVGGNFGNKNFKIKNYLFKNSKSLLIKFSKNNVFLEGKQDKRNS